ncbi:hypothetical protein GCM10014719_03560 [Planomonospora parontospora subsp. antibiotica]|nr:hypothetical protein GCM10014719_03560 [Planomonospora parontospora subsp. antibiotica]GII13515.1 hypothetical protein Ppa05_02410 [Planomonospora parontospora subsp. antibiotica]
MAHTLPTGHRDRKRYGEQRVKIRLQRVIPAAFPGGAGPRPRSGGGAGLRMTGSARPPARPDRVDGAPGPAGRTRRARPASDQGGPSPGSSWYE